MKPAHTFCLCSDLLVPLGPSSSGKLQDDQQRSHEDAAQSQRAPIHDKERRMCLCAPLVHQLHGGMLKMRCHLGANVQKDTLSNFPFVRQTRHYTSPYLVYHEKVKTSRVFIRDCSMVSVYPLVLFGGGQVHMELHKGEFVISLDDGWIRFAAASHQVRSKS